MAQFKIKRRDVRVEVALPVLLTTTDTKGRPVEQQVTTIDISRQGALLRGFRGALRTGKIVWLTRNDKTQEFRVAWVGPKGTPKAGQIGLSAVDPPSPFWDDVLQGRERPAAARSLAAHA